MSTTISVRLPDALALELNDISKATERPKSFHVQKALETYVEDQADLQISIDRINDHTDSIISLDDMKNRLGL